MPPEIILPEVCIYCRHFPCLKEDQEATVTTELKGDYPFLSEDPSLKFCEGLKFSFIDAVSDVEDVEYVDVVGGEDDNKTPHKTTVDPPEDTEKKAYILKRTNVDDLQHVIDKILEDSDVVGFDIRGPATTFDPESSVTNLVVILIVEYKKQEDVSIE